jgi:multidrug resistance efflux pump
MRFKHLFWAFFSVVVLLLTAAYLWQRPSVVTQPLPETLEERVAMLAPQAAVTQLFPVELEGEVVAAYRLTVRAPIDGVLQHLRSAVDEAVSAGEQLAVLYSTELTQKRLDNDSKVAELGATLRLYSQISSPDLRKLQATLDGGQQKYRYAEASFQKVDELFQRGLVSGKEHADAAVQLEADKFALAAAQRELEDARSLAPANYLKIYNQLEAAQLEQKQLEKTQTELTLRAPFAGQLRRYAPAKNHDADLWAVGATIKAGEPLFHIESDNRVVNVDVGPAMLPHFALGDAVQVVGPGEASRALQGVVQAIIRAPYESGTTAFSESVTQLRIAVSEGALSLAENPKVTVSKMLPQHGIPVSSSAVLSEGAERFVYVRSCADAAGRYTRRRVVLSGEQAGMALVTAGLLDGECIANIVEGMPWNR